MLLLASGQAAAGYLASPAPRAVREHRVGGASCSRLRSPVAMRWGERLDKESIGDPEAKPTALQKDHGKLIITLATTGNINTKERNPALPCSPEEMADDMHECIKLGVSVLHIHARDENNKPTMRVDKFRETVRRVKERDPDVVIQISTGGRAPLDGVDPGTWRMDPLNLKPEMASYTPGSVPPPRPQRPTPQPRLAPTRPPQLADPLRAPRPQVNLGPIVYQNNAKLVQDMAQRFCETGIKPQVEVFDTNMISNCDLLVKQGLLKRPIDFGFVMGAPGAQECSLRQLGHLTSMLQPGDTWTSIGIGKFEMPLAYMAIAMGGHVRAVAPPPPSLSRCASGEAAGGLRPRCRRLARRRCGSGSRTTTRRPTASSPPTTSWSSTSSTWQR